MRKAPVRRKTRSSISTSQHECVVIQFKREQVITRGEVATLEQVEQLLTRILKAHRCNSCKSELWMIC